MPKKKPAVPAQRIYMILDKSGSMNEMREGVISGFAEYISEAKATLPDALFSLTLFDSEPGETQPATPIAKVEPLTEETYQPSGWTALYDTIGKVLEHAEGEAAKDDRVIIVVFTDGQENWSHKYLQREILDKVFKKRANGWAFVFFGANIDSYTASSRIGVDRGNVANFEATSVGIKTAMKAAFRSSHEYTTRGAVRDLVSDEDRSTLENGGRS